MDKIFFADAIKSLIQPEPVYIDGKVFRLHYKFTAAILFVFSLLVTSTQFFGDPILCIEAKDVPQALLNTYCWIEGTFTLPAALRKSIGSEVAAPGVEQLYRDEDAVEHSYYQWVTFVFLLQALCFLASRVMWIGREGGVIKNLVLKLNQPILGKDDKNKNIQQLVKYFHAHLHKHTEYVLAYSACELFNFVHVILQIYFLDRFLGGEFTEYGPQVVKFLNMDQEVRVDPMIKVFPLVTKCRFHRYGSSGDVQKYDTMCVLPINILNSKLVVFLWFWFVMLAILSGLSVLYRFVVLRYFRIRYLMLQATNRLTPDDVLDKILQKFSYGDWFVLYRLSTNLDDAHCRDLLIALADSFKGDLTPSDVESQPEETEHLLDPNGINGLKQKSMPTESVC